MRGVARASAACRLHFTTVMSQPNKMNRSRWFHVASSALIALAMSGCAVTFGYDYKDTSGQAHADGGPAAQQPDAASEPDAATPRVGDGGNGGNGGSGSSGGSDAGVASPGPDARDVDAGQAALPVVDPIGGVNACRDVVPEAPPAATAAGTASGTLITGASDPRQVRFQSAVYLQQPGSDYVQLVVSDDPDLCNTLSTQRQAPMCSLDPATSPDVTSHAYLSAVVARTPSDHTSVGQMAYYRGAPARMDTPEFDGHLVVNEPTAGTSAPLTGEFYLCDGTHSISSSGTFSAQYCATALPICH